MARGVTFPTNLIANISQNRMPEEVVGLGRLELPTSRLSGVRSNHLSYRPGSRASSMPKKEKRRRRCPALKCGLPPAGSGPLFQENR